MSQPTAEKGPFVLILLPRGAPPAWRELADEIAGWLEGGPGLPDDGFALVRELRVRRGSSRRELERAVRALDGEARTADAHLVLGEDWLPIAVAALLGAADTPRFHMFLPEPPQQEGETAWPRANPGPERDGELESLLAARALGPAERVDPNLDPKDVAQLLVDRTRRQVAGAAANATPLDDDWLAIAEEVFEAQRRLLDWGHDLVQHRRDMDAKGWLAPRLGRARRRVRRFLRKRGWV
ncbi:MAG: hypothetical protein GC161_06490 [Planctomycetaceae bacterium]|nr:hypothetical protein [Planctomycetaceae bacterium]